jgi:type IV secretion system protein VirD4
VRVFFGTILVVCAMAYVWLAATSGLYCRLAGKWDLFQFPYMQWAVVAPWWLTNWHITLYVVASAVVPSMPVLMVLAWLLAGRRRRRRLSRPLGGGLRPLEAGVTDNHGHAAFATNKQLADHFSKRGCLIGAINRGPDSTLLYDDVTRGPGHSLVIAGPGSGKSTSAVTRLMNWHGPRVVFDPSCELGPIMTDALVARGMRVVSIDLHGNGLNTLDWIDPAHPESDTHIRTSVDHIYNEDATGRASGSQSRDPFWSTWGRALVTCLMAHMIHDHTGSRTLAELRRGISMPEGDMPAMLRGIHGTSRSKMARDLAGGLMGMRADQTFSGIYSNSFAATEWLSVGPYAKVVSGDAMRSSDILRPDTVVFVQLPLRTLLVTPAVGRAVLGALFNAVFQADGGITDRILFEIDEAATLGPMKEILLMHTTARKYGAAVQTIWQSDAQIEAVWGREGAKTMRDTSSWRSYNAISDGDIAEKLSRDLGEHAVMAYSEGLNTGSQKPWGLHLPSASYGSNTSMHEVKRRLIKADEIMRAEPDEMYVLVRGFPQPIRCVTAPYWRYPGLASQMQANRFAIAMP